MLLFPNCKINIGLTVTGKRSDGYHNIETIFYPVKLNDALEIIHSASQPTSPQINFTTSGNPIEGVPDDNLCMRACSLILKDFPNLPSFNIHLHKSIPAGAGLGGGSADAAYTLMALNEKFALGLSTSQLLSYSALLGSDCPFFIINTPCIGKGRGEVLENIQLSLSGYRLFVVNPGIHINTGWAFSQLTFNEGEEENSPSRRPLEEVLLQPVDRWKEHLINDFEAPVFKKYPEIENIKENLYRSGALFSLMSGSGSSVYGIFERSKDRFPGFPPHYLTSNIML